MNTYMSADYILSTKCALCTKDINYVDIQNIISSELSEEYFIICKECYGRFKTERSQGRSGSS